MAKANKGPTRLAPCQLWQVLSSMPILPLLREPPFRVSTFNTFGWFYGWRFCAHQIFNSMVVIWVGFRVWGYSKPYIFFKFKNLQAWFENQVHFQGPIYITHSSRLKIVQVQSFQQTKTKDCIGTEFLQLVKKKSFIYKVHPTQQLCSKFNLLRSLLKELKPLLNNYFSQSQF